MDVEYTFSNYLGPEFQQHLMWQLLVEPDFAEKTIAKLSSIYFDDPSMKRLFIVVKNYFDDYEKAPNLQNDTISIAINKYKSKNDILEEEMLFSIIKRIKNWNERILNRDIEHNGVVIQAETISFIKQQEYRKVGEYILGEVKNGGIRDKTILAKIEEKFHQVANIGDNENYGTEVLDDIDNVLKKEFRETTSTGVVVLDSLTGGGLGKGEIGLILTPSGVGKTTLLTKIANEGYEEGKNVLQAIFEDTPDQIKRKHYTIWSKIPLSQIDERYLEVKEKSIAHVKNMPLKSGRLVIMPFSQENTTMSDIRNFMTRYEKKHSIKFDLLVLDYLDCLEPNKKSVDRTEGELQIVKSFLALSADFNIPAWSAIQANRTGIETEFVEASQSGGSIKRLQKAHFFMSVAKPKDMKEADMANIRIIKARFAKDGQTFKECKFNNDTLQIIIDDREYDYKYSQNKPKKYTDSDVEKMHDKINDPRDTSEMLLGVFQRVDESIMSGVDDSIEQPKDDLLELIEVDEIKDLPIENDDYDKKMSEYLNYKSRHQDIMRTKED